MSKKGSRIGREAEKRKGTTTEKQGVRLAFRCLCSIHTTTYTTEKRKDKDKAFGICMKNVALPV